MTGNEVAEKVCGTCKFRCNKGFCNNDNICEDWGRKDDGKDDKLIYSYSEGGTFKVGVNFGCVHHEE